MTKRNALLLSLALFAGSTQASTEVVQSNEEAPTAVDKTPAKSPKSPKTTGHAKAAEKELKKVAKYKAQAQAKRDAAAKLDKETKKAEIAKLEKAAKALDANAGEAQKTADTLAANNTAKCEGKAIDADLAEALKQAGSKEAKLAHEIGLLNSGKMADGEKPKKDEQAVTIERLSAAAKALNVISKGNAYAAEDLRKRLVSVINADASFKAVKQLAAKVGDGEWSQDQLKAATEHMHKLVLAEVVQPQVIKTHLMSPSHREPAPIIGKLEELCQVPALQAIYNELVQIESPIDDVVTDDQSYSMTTKIIFVGGVAFAVCGTALATIAGIANKRKYKSRSNSQVSGLVRFARKLGLAKGPKAA